MLDVTPIAALMHRAQAQLTNNNFVALRIVLFKAHITDDVLFNQVLVTLYDCVRVCVLHHFLLSLFLNFWFLSLTDYSLHEFCFGQHTDLINFWLSWSLLARWLNLHPLTHLGSPAGRSIPWLFTQADVWQLTSKWIDGIPLLLLASLCVVISLFCCCFLCIFFTYGRWLSRLELWKSLDKVFDVFIGDDFRICVVKFKVGLLH